MSGGEMQTCGKPIDQLVERVLAMNILQSDYFKELYRLKSYGEVIDEIYNQVDHVEPWMAGNCRGSSTAFCLLYKFFTMKLNIKQVQTLLHHKDSPYIRAVGFLYLRYMADPKTLWNWFQPHIQDEEEFSPGTNGRMTKMGVYIRDLLLDQYYFDTLFPRIPVPVIRQITSNLERLKLPTTPQGTTGTGGRYGSDETARRPPSVKAALSVSFGQRAPHRASTRDSSPVRRSLPNGSDERNRSVDRDRSRDNKERRESDNDRDRPRSRESDYRDRRRDRDYDRRDRNWRRDRDRSPDRDRYSRHRSRSRSPRRSRSPARDKSAISANLLKLRDMYGDASGKKEEGIQTRARDSSGEDVIRLGGTSWR